MEPIETAADFYTEIKKRGLHLRKENGRDNALLSQLATKLGCPDIHLQKYLNESDLSAEKFLIEFMHVAAPFSKMFQEIWEYLSRQCAPRAGETISVRFGFEEDGLSINLEEFRQYVETARRVVSTINTELWPVKAFDELWGVAKALGNISTDLYSQIGHYRPGEHFDLPDISPSDHQFDPIIKSVRSIFQQIINEYAYEHEQNQLERRLPEIQVAERSYSSLNNLANRLTDLLPTWYYVFVAYKTIPVSAKDKALVVYENNVKPLLTPSTDIKEATIREALDVLNLPFWRHRWHTYEVWATILTLRSLDNYCPSLRQKEGKIPIDGYSAEILADLKSKEHKSACLAIQYETPFSDGNRKAIKPDLRICFGDPADVKMTAAVVEFKQRNTLDSGTLNEMAHAYSKGCPKSGGVIILNYDDTRSAITLPEKAHLIEGVQPLNRDAIKQFQERLLAVLDDAGLGPDDRKVMVLLDVSGSMGDSYCDVDVQTNLRLLVEKRWIKILRFNSGLVSGGDLDETSMQALATAGGTELGRALAEIENFFGLPSKLLLITDGEHESPAVLRRIQSVIQCMPGEIGNHIGWLEE